jgi:hypothetical protein
MQKKTDSIFLADAGFICDKASVAVAVRMNTVSLYYESEQ